MFIVLSHKHHNSLLCIIVKLHRTCVFPGFPSEQQHVDLTESPSDQVQLIHVRLPRPQRDPRQQLSEHATNRPNVHRRAVLSVPHQQLGGPVPTSGHVVRVVVTWTS